MVRARIHLRGADRLFPIHFSGVPMICQECNTKAIVAYETRLTEYAWEVVGYCEEHDPYPNMPYDKPFDSDIFPKPPLHNNEHDTTPRHPSD